MHENFEFPDKTDDKEWQESIFEAFSKETDRAVGIISVCYLDTVLQGLIKAAFIKDAKIDNLFKNDRLLQSFYSKINIAYFSGLIPKIIYTDLILINEIRNRFAHGIEANITFSDKVVSRKIDDFSQLPPEVINIYPLKLKYILIVVHIGSYLRGYTSGITKLKWLRPSEAAKDDKLKFQKLILTPSEIKGLIEGKKIKRKI
jgi:DNA-binding MltR family transcriptional regulator